MKTVICLMFACVLMASTAQAQAPAPPAAQGGQKIPFSEGLRRSYNTLKMNLTETAQKFDEADYGYTPSPDIRVFGAQLAHVANSQFNACAAAKGEANPNQGSNLEKTKTTRADIIQALADSFAFCDRGIREPDRPERARAREAGAERSRARLGADEPHRARQRRVRHSDGLHAHQGHGAAVDRARHARSWRCGTARKVAAGVVTKSEKRRTNRPHAERSEHGLFVLRFSLQCSPVDVIWGRGPHDDPTITDDPPYDCERCPRETTPRRGRRSPNRSFRSACARGRCWPTFRRRRVSCGPRALAFSR